MNKLTLISFVLVALLSPASFGSEKETGIALKNAPAAVQKTITKTVGDGTLIKLVRETERDGAVIYEALYTVKGRKFESEISAKGELLVTDEKIDLSAAPAPVQKLFKERIAGGKLIKVEKATTPKDVFYEVEFLKDGKKQEIKASKDGRVLETETEPARESKAERD